MPSRGGDYCDQDMVFISDLQFAFYLQVAGHRSHGSNITSGSSRRSYHEGVRIGRSI